MFSNWNSRWSGTSRLRTIGVLPGPLITSSMIRPPEVIHRHFRILGRQLTNRRHRSCFSSNYKRRRYCIRLRIRIRVGRTSTILILLMLRRIPRILIRLQFSIPRQWLGLARENSNRHLIQLKLERQVEPVLVAIFQSLRELLTTQGLTIPRNSIRHQLGWTFQNQRATMKTS